MKARFLALAALVLGLASCQNDFEAGNIVAGGEVDFQLSVGADELATRAGKDGEADDLGAKDSAFGAIDYFQGADWNSVDLRYTLEVYDKADDYTGKTPVKDRMVKVVDAYEPVVFDLRLVPNRDYHFVVFADFVGQGATDTPTVDAQAEIGLRHNIGETLQDITIKENEDANKWLNDEVADAYFAFEDIKITNSDAQDIVLRRPYGKLRVIATDLAELNLNVDPKAVVVEYEDTHNNLFNAVTGTISGGAKGTKSTYKVVYNDGVGKESLANHTYTEGYDAKKVENANGKERHSHITLFTDYILANKEQESIHFTMKVYDDAAMADVNLIKETAFTTDIPVQRNHLTTIIGNVLTTATEIEVRIDDNFAGEYQYYDDIETTESFAEALKNAEQSDEATIDLVNDVTWATGAGIGSTPWISEDAKVKVLTVNANGHKITATGSGVGQIRMANGGKLIINNAVIEDKSVSYAENNWEYGYLEFGGKLEFNECQFVNAVMMSGEEATFNKCTFNSNKDSEYAVWVDNGKAYFNECTVAGPRGIKTHEAYGSEVIEIIVDKCAFNNISKKPGMAIGTMNAETAITIKNSTFNNCQPGDQGLYIYETDTDVTSFNFTEENNAVNVTVATNEALAEALKANVRNLNIALEADVTVDVSAHTPEYYFGGNNTNTITIDGAKIATASATGADNNAYTLTFNHKNSDWNYIRCNNDNAKWVIKNVKLTNSGYNNGPWNRHDIRFYNDVVLENVTSDKAIALLANGNLTNVVISDVHPSNSEAYALWITAEGQTVNIKDCALLAHESKKTDRGIKIDEQYVNDAVAKVTLNVDGLKVKSQKKAAIMVKSAAGAEINLKNINIAEVAEDSDFAVWVDEDAEAYADLVTVTGGLKKVEGAGDAVVGTQEDFAAAVVEGATIYLNEGTYNMPSTDGKDITIVGDKDVIINAGAANMGSGNVTLEGVTITAGSYKGFQHSGVVTYNNVTIQGQLNCYGKEDIFNGCTFDLDNTYVWTYGSKKTVFNKCTFNTTGKAILIYNEGAGACNVEVTNCTFNATAGAKAGAIANQNCAAIEIDNYAKMAHKLTTSGNTVDNEFSGEWRIKSYVEGAPVTVNGVEYTYIAVDGKKMTIDGDKNVTVVE